MGGKGSVEGTWLIGRKLTILACELIKWLPPVITSWPPDNCTAPPLCQRKGEWRKPGYRHLTEVYSGTLKSYAELGSWFHLMVQSGKGKSYGVVGFAWLQLLSHDSRML